LAHGPLNALLKIGWGLEVDRAGSKALAKDLMIFVALGADSASMEMILNLQHSHRVQLAIQVAGI
jgi:hypothetical protein